MPRCSVVPRGARSRCQRVLRDQPQRAQRRAQGAAHFAKMGDVEPVDHHAAEQCKFRQRRPQPCEILSELSAVEADRLEHTAAGGRARFFRIIVGIGFHRLQPDFRFRLEIADRLRPARQKYRPQIGVVAFRNGAGKIIDGARQAVIEARLLHQGVAGDPDHSARPRRGAADEFGLLDDENAHALRGGHRSRRHAAGARANDDDIVSVGSRHDRLARLEQTSSMVAFILRDGASRLLRMRSNFSYAARPSWRGARNARLEPCGPWIVRRSCRR